ncbi:uncharacterized protein AMSG_05116 [Thecamonas trahens ATCC 50062]|uniref:Uncharacterized protein n=1 Tax=Thecamonas trahens ATCC 50062 TaxID=461836 RepID=A0A0L0DAN7_THETB|nr:hypothetical protein AMSG_05116 [Thecamonas trahens ATCC 50062]KNC49141.1 hypothetical protein AMSG_05116 [Thecamonas trahens ATCC 50062]|eukprot:XP_013758166.1 hypothetical protein AMSG_05116 [Thecamonas trahens ATCC 50062]
MRPATALLALAALIVLALPVPAVEVTTVLLPPTPILGLGVSTLSLQPGGEYLVATDMAGQVYGVDMTGPSPALAATGILSFDVPFWSLKPFYSLPSPPGSRPGPGPVVGHWGVAIDRVNATHGIVVTGMVFNASDVIPPSMGGGYVLDAARHTLYLTGDASVVAVDVRTWQAGRTFELPYSHTEVEPLSGILFSDDLALFSASSDRDVGAHNGFALALALPPAPNEQLSVVPLDTGAGWPFHIARTKDNTPLFISTNGTSIVPVLDHHRTPFVKSGPFVHIPKNQGELSELACDVAPGWVVTLASNVWVSITSSDASSPPEFSVLSPDVHKYDSKAMHSCTVIRDESGIATHIVVGGVLLGSTGHNGNAIQIVKF